MDKRFLNFILIATAIWMLNLLIVIQLQPPPPDPPAVPDKAESASDPRPAPLPAAPIADPSTTEDPPTEGLAPAAPVRQQYLSLGSVDPASGFRMAVLITNEGAAIRRVELAEDRYRDAHDRSGYVGHLEVAPADGGVAAGVVVRGTPAAKAGLRPGDIISAIGYADGSQTTVADAAEFQAALATTRPGDTISLQLAGGRNESLSTQLTRRPLEVMRPELENLQMREAEVPDGFDDPPSYLLTMAQVGTSKLRIGDGELAGVDLMSGNWEIVESSEDSALMRRRLPQIGVEVDKLFQLEQVPTDQLRNPDYPAYGLTCTIRIRNAHREPQTLAYRLMGPTGLPVEGWWHVARMGRNWGGMGLRNVVARYEGSGPIEVTSPDIVDDDVEPLGQGKSLAYIGVDAQYFASAVIPAKANLSEIWFEKALPIRIGPVPDRNPPPPTLHNVSFHITSKETTLAAGEVLTHSFRIFSGPKRPKLLSQYSAVNTTAYSLEDFVYFGWFAPVAKVMAAILHFFYSVIGNYGISIVLLTVLVRSFMFPLSRKQALNMIKMQELKPELDRIAEKYKNDMEKRTRAQQELFRKNNYNPTGSCLVMFLQLPIFIGLYRSLMVDVELRQAPLFTDAIRWCSNLAAPDMFLNWSGIMPDMVNNGEGIMGLGPYLNLLPLVTVFLFLLQQKMFMPEPANEQAAMQQNIMKYMMVFIGFLFYKVACGLCIYFIASSLWGIAERQLLPKVTPADPAQPAEKASQSSAPRKDGSAAGASAARGKSQKNGQAASKRRQKSKRKR